MLLILLLPCTVMAAAPSEDFDGINAQIISDRPSTSNPDSLFDPPHDQWTYGHGPTDALIAVAGINNGGTFTNGLSDDYAGDQVLFLNFDGTSNVTHFFLQTTDGSNVQVDSLEVGNNLSGYATTGTITILSGGVTVGSAAFDLGISSSANGITYTYQGDSGSDSDRPYGIFNFDATYRDVDEIDLDFATASTPIFDNLTVSPAVANAPPTVTHQPANVTFDQNTEGNVDLAGTTFADGNGDSLTVTLAIDAGAFGASVADGSGIGGGVTATRVSDGQVTLAGSAADINTYLATPSNITWVPPTDVSGPGVATLTLSASDGFDGLAADPTISFDVSQTIAAAVPTPMLASWSRLLLILSLGAIGVAGFMCRRFGRG